MMTSLYQNPMTNDTAPTPSDQQQQPQQQQQQHHHHNHHHDLQQQHLQQQQHHHQHHEQQQLQTQQQQQQQHLLEYPELRVVFDFFTDNPQKVMPLKRSGHKALESSMSLGLPAPVGLGHSSSDVVVADPYWNSIRRMQADDSFLEGMLLRSVDHKPQYPYLHYIVYKDISSAQDKSRASLERRDTATRGSKSPDNDLWINFHTNKTRGLYKEMCTYVTPDTPLLPKRPTNPNTAFSLSAFKTVGNLENLDRSWTYWSGADYIVENIPKSLKLERLTFHKLLPSELSKPFVSRAPSLAAGFGDVDVCRESLAAASPASDHGSALWTNGNRDVFSYVLLCEIGEALLDVNRSREFIDTLKYRQCGVTSLYVIDHFF